MAVVTAMQTGEPASECFAAAVQGDSMAQAIVDPAQLRQFAQTLKMFNENLIEQSTGLASQLATLSNTWRDQENRKFCEQFEGHMRLLARFIESNNEHIPYLLRKAEHIEEYLQER